MRSFQALQASRSASRRASSARSADIPDGRAVETVARPGAHQNAGRRPESSHYSLESAAVWLKNAVPPFKLNTFFYY